MPDSTWEVEVDRSSPADWAEMLDDFCDANLYQTWSYGEVRWGRKNLSHLVLKRRGEVVAIAQLRIVRPAPLNFGIAYLRWGPLCERRGEASVPEVAVAMAQALQEEYAVNRRLALRIVPNAFGGSPRASLFETAFSKFKREAPTPGNVYRTFVLDLSPPIDQLRRNLDVKWRNMLTQSEKKGLEILSGTGAGEYGMFSQMYCEMKKRKGFQSTVDIEEFANIHEQLPEPHRLRIWICQDKGVPVAGLVASAMGDSAIYVLGATSDKGLTAKGAYLLQWAAIQWLKANGYRWYDLGGIDPEGNPGVHRFKKGISGADVTQIQPLMACDSVVSSAVVRAGFAFQRAMRNCQGMLPSSRPLTPQISSN